MKKQKTKQEAIARIMAREQDILACYDSLMRDTTTNVWYRMKTMAGFNPATGSKQQMIDTIMRRTYGRYWEVVFSGKNSVTQL